MSPFTVKSRDKSKCIKEVVRIVEEFEPNSNYELELYVRKIPNPRGGGKARDWWAVTTRLVFPHMSYKRPIVQADLWGKSREGVDLSPRKKYNRHVLNRSFSNLLRRGQATLTPFENETTPLEYCITARSLPIYKLETKA